MKKRCLLPLALGLLFLALFSSAYSPASSSPTPLADLATAPGHLNATQGEKNTVANSQAADCPGAPAISARRNAWAYISLHPPASNNVRSEPGLKGKWIGRLKPGEPVWVADGPRCADGYTWWFVQNLTGLEGWTAEGDASGYWLIQPLEAFFYDTVDGSATAKLAMDKGKKYRVTLSGTYSFWVPEQWADPGVCIRGEYEFRPMFPSPKKTNGRVGADPYYRFARPFYGACQFSALNDPGETVSRIMFSLDGGKSYSIPIPLVEKYRKDHTYIYTVKGQGHPLKVKLDDVPLDDNYGQIFITIEKVD